MNCMLWVPFQHDCLLAGLAICCCLNARMQCDESIMTPQPDGASTNNAICKNNTGTLMVDPPWEYVASAECIGAVQRTRFMSNSW
mmetsp:Transcript_12111/g.22017  ORF Transcript_12111/g.22017 Transcript_12111/m.22017 type:complete len:85 (+) Transcript_12111:1127-1381(+)